MREPNAVAIPSAASVASPAGAQPAELSTGPTTAPTAGSTGTTTAGSTGTTTAGLTTGATAGSITGTTAVATAGLTTGSTVAPTAGPAAAPADAAEPLIIDELRDGVLWITLNRPDRMNTVTPALYAALGPIIERAARDDAVRCVVLTGAGRAFCAGRDVKAGPTIPFAQTPGDWIEARTDYLRRVASIVRMLHALPKPTIAMINGACAGAGLSLAGACDLRLASKSAVLTSAFVKVGLPGDAGGIWFWSRILGSGKARRLYLMSERFDGDAALAFGLVDRVVDDATLAQETTTLALEFAAGSSRAYRYAKAALNAAEESHLDAILDLEASSMAMAGIDAALAAGEFATGA